jgi:hypothetical protein
VDFKGFGLIWLRTGTSIGLLTMWWTVVFHWIVEELLAS